MVSEENRMEIDATLFGFYFVCVVVILLALAVGFALGFAVGEWLI